MMEKAESILSLIEIFLLYNFVLHKQLNDTVFESILL